MLRLDHISADWLLFHIFSTFFSDMNIFVPASFKELEKKQAAPI